MNYGKTQLSTGRITIIGLKVDQKNNSYIAVTTTIHVLQFPL
jgi:hypothetical protein